MSLHRSLTQLAHELLAERLQPGDIAIDATAGNGHDTLFLAHRVGQTGEVHAYDIQAEALQATRRRLDEAGCAGRVQLHPASHSRLLHTLPADYRGRVAAVVFNLGYLPGGDRHTTTQSDSTLAALEQALALLRPGGVLSILAYRGHPGGREEARAVADWCDRQADLEHQVHESPGPVLHFCIRHQQT